MKIGNNQNAAEGDLQTIEQDLKLQEQKSGVKPAAAKVRPVPEGHHTVTPYLAVKNGVKALEFYQKAFGAKERYRLVLPDGRLGHGEIQLGDSVIMLCDEFPEHGGKSPETLGGSPVNMHLYVENVDAFFKKAIEAGCKETMAVKDQPYGDRSGQLQDPFGHSWWVATHVKDVSPEEMEKWAKTACDSKEKK
jgi:PhnB protein